jgi:RNA polymerase sigma-70 factor (ECF subfamily)
MSVLTLPGSAAGVASEAVAIERVVVEPSDEDLAERVRAGDGPAYEALVRRHMRRAFSVAYRLLGQREDAEDLVQDALLAALQKIDSYQAGRPFAPWFYRILVNRGLNSRKSRSRRHTEALPLDVSAAGLSPLREAEQSELRKLLSDALDTLPERQRTVVGLFELEGFSSVEIAEILGLSDGTVRWHLHQARQALRNVLAPFARRSE